MKRLLRLSALMPALMVAVPAWAADGPDLAIAGHVSQPPQLPAAATAALDIPTGFTIEGFVESLENARSLAVSPDGSVYVARRDEGTVLMMKDNGAGRAAGGPVKVASRAGVRGIAFHDGKVYLVTAAQVFVADVLPDGRFGPLQLMVRDLSDPGLHNARTAVRAPSGGGRAASAAPFATAFLTSQGQSARPFGGRTDAVIASEASLVAARDGASSLLQR